MQSYCPSLHQKNQWLMTCLCPFLQDTNLNVSESHNTGSGRAQWNILLMWIPFCSVWRDRTTRSVHVNLDSSILAKIEEYITTEVPVTSYWTPANHRTKQTSFRFNLIEVSQLSLLSVLFSMCLFLLFRSDLQQHLVFICSSIPLQIAQLWWRSQIT